MDTKVEYLTGYFVKCFRHRGGGLPPEETIMGPYTKKEAEQIASRIAARPEPDTRDDDRWGGPHY